MKIGKIQQKTYEIIDTYDEFTLIEYIRGKSAKVKLKCKKCGYEFEKYAIHFNKYPHICPNCHPKGTSQKLPIEEVQKRVDKIFGEKQIQILEYNGNNALAKVKCLKCNTEFTRVPTVLWRGRTYGCPECTKTISLGEKKIKRILEKNKIQYIQQYRFSDCKYKTYLPFDFYLPQKKICIEFQSEQHYEKRSIYYSQEQIERDKIKKEYCLNNNIQLIIIPYWDIEKIESYLNF